MSSSIPSRDDSSQVGRAAGPYGRPAIAPDELLPPVEPPSARFIIQLFVVPAVIVAAVVGVWFVIESLARSGQQDPEQIVSALRSNNQARFQQAKDLADMLRLPERYPELKTNRDLARKLAAYVEELVTAGSTAEADVTMRYFLVSSLGEFYVTDGLPALIKAAREDAEPAVRRRAINAIAVLAGSMAERNQPITSDELTSALLQLSSDEEPLIRSETAFAIGVVAAAPGADSRLTGALESLADDTYTDARFNAAVGLARLGSARAVEGLAEMLDPDSIRSSLSGEKALNEAVTEQIVQSNRANKRNMIVANALHGVERLLNEPELPPESIAALREALGQFIEVAPTMDQPLPLPKELVQRAQRALARSQKRTS